MTTAVDSSVILDVLTDDRRFAENSERALRLAAREGQLILCECVLAEVFPVLGGTNDCEAFLRDWELSFVPSSAESAMLAGDCFQRLLARGGRRGRVVADFLIGAHARVHADRLVARDRGYLRDYFKELPLLDPSTH